ncbi:MAG: hypothetical protein BWY76_01704 [bacterium ADurb.Bin429]|nr:MAG: hypothetical protein BWY76_01704 [bacterium ADurb.Bin429]
MITGSPTWNAEASSTVIVVLASEPAGGAVIASCSTAVRSRSLMRVTAADARTFPPVGATQRNLRPVYSPPVMPSVGAVKPCDAALSAPGWVASAWNCDQWPFGSFGAVGSALATPSSSEMTSPS